MAELKQVGLTGVSVILAIIAFMFTMEQAGCGYFSSKSEVAELRRDMQQGFEEMNRRLDSLEGQMNRRVDKVDARLQRIEQNHLEHITELHATKVARQPKPPGSGE